jgi:hypothetical protein
MRQSVILLLVSLAGIMGGAALIGLWALGLAIVADSVAVGVYALLREDSGRAAPSVHEVPTLANVLERARHAS